VPLDHFQNLPRRRAIALVRDLLADLAVLRIIEVKRVLIKHAVPTQTVRLVNLEVKANARHATSIQPNDQTHKRKPTRTHFL
jgi:hypothetical protein